ncbi:MAG: IclR family transcriptional regulator [Deltaproteobacteria bacterium]|nr:IclR family transcriptional regulator [Deltaproteobacteria bacterium]
MVLDKKASRHAPAVDRAMDVIELMASTERDLSLSEILEKTRIPRQSLIRILHTLCDRGVLDRIGQRGGYRLGMRLLYLGHRLKDKIQLRSQAWPSMQQLAQVTHKTIELSTFDRDQLILIEQIEGTEGVRLYSRVGSAFPYLHAVSVGKVYLAHMDPDKRRNVLQKIGLPQVTEHTITDLDKLEEELQKIRENGYAFEDQELRKGVRRVAAPIYDFKDDIAGGLSIAATILSFELKDVDALGRLTVETASEISRNMGRHPGKRDGRIE